MDVGIIWDPVSAALEPVQPKHGEFGIRAGSRHTALGRVDDDQARFGQRVPEISQRLWALFVNVEPFESSNMRDRFRSE